MSHITLGEMFTSDQLQIIIELLGDRERLTIYLLMIGHNDAEYLAVIIQDAIRGQKNLHKDRKHSVYIATNGPLHGNGRQAYGGCGL
jgi:L-amino acid N-acyltransferase YncA